MCTAGRKKKRNGEAEGATAYLLVVVVGQALAVQPHPPPLEDAIPAGKKRGGCGGGAQTEAIRQGREGWRRSETQTGSRLAKFRPPTGARLSSGGSLRQKVAATAVS